MSSQYLTNRFKTKARLQVKEEQDSANHKSPVLPKGVPNKGISLPPLRKPLKGVVPLNHKNEASLNQLSNFNKNQSGLFQKPSNAPQRVMEGSQSIW